MNARSLQQTLLIPLVAAFFGVAASADADLIHRWSFNELSGTTVQDSVGGAHGALKQIVVDGTPAGSLPFLDGVQATLDGVGGYIDLPNGLISELTNVTFEIWMTWHDASQAIQWLWGVGSITNAQADGSGLGSLEDTDGTLRDANGGLYLGTRYFYFTPQYGTGAGDRARTGVSDGTDASPWTEERPVLRLDAFQLPVGYEVHLAVTYGPTGARLFYLGSQYAAGYVTNMIPLSEIEDVNFWLGRSLYGADPMFAGSINEFRIHDRQLTSQELTASFYSGSPDIVNYGAGAATSLTMTLADNMVVGFVQTPQLTASFANIGTITIYPQDLDSFTSSDTNVVAIDPLGRLTAVGPGSATITATLAGLPAQTATINVTASNPELKHRYSFNEEPGATTLTDSVGGAHATVVGPNVILGGGEAFLNNTGGYETASYIDLPDGIISARSNITIELWYTWTRTEGNQQRLFDFGSSTKADGYATNTGSGLTWLSLSPIEWGNAMQLLYSTNGNPPQLTLSAPRSPANEEVHVAVIYAPDSGLSRIYVNGVPRATGTAPARLSDLVDINNWLGVSQWDDTPFGGRYNEFRIWEGVLTDLDIALSRHAGPDASVVGNAGELQSIEVPDQVLLIGNPANAQAILHANFENYQGVEIQSISGVSFQSLDTNVFTSTSGGSLNDVALGTAELVASYSGLTATGTVSVIAPTSVTLGLTNRMKAGGLPVNAILTADFTSTITNVNVTGFEGVTWSSSDTNVAAVSATGQVTPKNPGVAVITASYGGRTDDVTLTVELPAGFTKGQLIHRYSFNEAPDTTTVTDSVGGAHGTVINLVPGSAEDNFNGLGQLVMSGTGNSGSPGSAYVDLPNGLVSGLSAVTIEGWVVWRSEVQHTRFFDFGNSNAGEGSAGTGQGYMMFSPWSGSSRTRFAIKQGTQAETPSLASSVALTAGPDLIHYAVVYDPPNGVVRIYINGQRTGTAAVSLLLSVVQDVNNWLGRSQWSGDAMLNGLYDEFRIYNGPLLDADIAASYAAGPDALPADAPALKIRAELPNLILSWSAEAEGFELEAADDVSGPYSSAGLPAPQQVGDEYQVTVPASGQSRFFRLSK